MSDGAELKFSEAALAEHRELGWLSGDAQLYVAKLMELPPAHVRAVVTFYTMFYQKPVGRWHLEVCTNLSCRLRGAEQIVEAITDKLGIKVGETTADKKFTLSRAECLASCGTAPMLQLNHDRYYENLSPESTLKLIDELFNRGD